MSVRYKVHEFAKLAGTTVKALHHYDRLGLLKPRRTEAGYRLYGQNDLERLEQIIALKFLGIPLKQIKVMLDGPARDLSDVLRLQRQALEQKQVLLARAIRAIRAAEEAVQTGKPADPTLLKRIIEVIDMQTDIEMMKKYYSTEEAWELRRRYYEEGPSSEWRELYRDIQAALGQDPGGDRAQALAERWLKLSVRAAKGDPDVQTDNIAAWKDREHWPSALKQRLAEFRLEEIVAFIQEASLCGAKRYFSQAGWTKLQEMRKLQLANAERGGADHSAQWQARVALFRDLEAAADSDPANETGQTLAARWLAMVEESSHGDPELKEGNLRTWADRCNWPSTLRWQMEALYGMVGERFDRAADFLHQAVAAALNRR